MGSGYSNIRDSMWHRNSGLYSSQEAQKPIRYRRYKFGLKMQIAAMSAPLPPFLHAPEVPPYGVSPTCSSSQRSNTIISEELCPLLGSHALSYKVYETVSVHVAFGYPDFCLNPR